MRTMAVLLALATAGGLGAETTDRAAADFLTTAGRARWVQERLGTQISTVNVMGGAVGREPDARPVAYAGLMGQPGRLAVVDAASGKAIRVLDVAGAEGMYDILVSGSGTVYLASHPNGNFYRYEPGGTAVEKVGRVADHVSFIWDLCEGPDGKIYGACYPKSTLFEYDPASGAIRDLGPAKEGEDYARCIVYDAGRSKLYVGIGSHAALMEVDPKTLEKRNILPKELHEGHFVYSVGLAGSSVIARLDPSNKAYVLNPATGSVEANMGDFNSNAVSDPQGPEGAVYYTGAGQLMTYSQGEAPRVAHPFRANAAGRGFGWVPSADGRTTDLVTVLSNGQLLRFSPAAQKASVLKAEIPPQPIHIQNILCGPDGKVYSSGYVVGNLGVFDPATEKSSQIAGTKQAEGMTTYGTKLFLGTYPRARISVFDTAKEVGRGNPVQLFDLDAHGQDRPFGILGVPEVQKVFIGTVPSYGLLGGALAIYDPVTSDLAVHRDLVAKQGVVTLLYKDGILYGGTTIHGGLGIEPTEKEAKLFAWDVMRGEKLYETVPVAGKRGISGLRVGPDGNIWGWAEGALFVFDPASRQVTYSEEKFTLEGPPRHFWRGGSMLELAPDGFYGMIFGRLYRLDPATKAVEVLAQGESLELLTRDTAGRLYFVQKDQLMRLAPR